MKYHVIRSYTVCEVHHVEADNEDAAIKLVEDGVEDFFVKSYDDDYDKNKEGEIQYTVEEA
ncbi:hypothetical protein OAA20_00535 [bacterium]|nr:hypothetical protein [bacterium]